MNIKHTKTSSQRNLSQATNTADFAHDHSPSDNREREEVIYKLRQRASDLAPSQTITLAGATISLESGSSLENALLAGRQLLQRMCEQASFIKLLAALQLSDRFIFEVTAEGKMNAVSGNNTTGLENAFVLAPDLKEDLQTLIDMAELTGGKISNAEQIDLTQWLAFHGFLIPRNAHEVSRLVAFMNAAPTPGPVFGNYREMIKSSDGNTATLSAAQRGELRKLIVSYTKGESLLEHLSERVLGGRSTPFTRSEAEEIIDQLVSSPIAVHWANAYVRDLGWYGAQPDQPQSATSRKQIILTSLLLDLHPLVGEQEPRNHVAGFDLYAAEHLEQSFAEVQTKFENHLIAHHRVSQRNVALAAHLLLAEPAPEFLVNHMPATLLLGTPQCVEYCRIVAVHEIIAPGSTRSMSYAKLQQLSTLEPATESRKKLDALAAVDPVIDWALLNKIVSPEDLEKSVPEALKVATDAYVRHARTLAANAETLQRPLPTRRSVALDILEQVAKGCTYLERDVLGQVRNVPLEDAYTSLRLSPVELHMSNDLATGDWDLKKGESIYKAFPDLLRNLVSPDGEFHRQFNRAYVTHMQAMHTHLKQAFSFLPLPERTRLLKGKVTMFTVRPSVAKLQTITSLPVNPIASVIDSIVKTTERKPTESHKEIDEAKGRYGVVIYCEYEGQGSCYELLTLHGICRENTQLAALIQQENLLDQKVPSPGVKYSTPATVLQLPTDIECYTHGVTPGLVAVSSGVIDRVGELPAEPPTQINGYYQSFYSREFDRLVNFVLKHRPIATYDELVKECWGQTRLEALRIKRDKDLDTFLNVVVPFKSCIEDLSSDDIERQVQGAGACALEAAMTVLLVVAAIAKIATVVAKSVSVATKAGKIASTGLGLVNSLINPLDGATDVVIKGAKFLRKGWHSGLAALEGAIYDARKWTAKPAYHTLSTALDTDTLRLGTRQYAQSSTDLSQVWGIRHTDEWYAMNRLGEPWGPPLRELKIVNFIRNPFKRTKPFSYTRGYLKRAIPHAKSKIDNAIALISDARNEDVRTVLLHLFGTDSNAAAEHITNNLRHMRRDLDFVRLENMIFRPPGSKAYAALQPQAYKRWRAAVYSNTKLDVNTRTFLSIYPDNLDEMYEVAKFNDAKIGDVLVHEMSHGAPGTLDFYYGDAIKGATPAEYDAVGLLEFARNPRKAHPDNRANPHFGYGKVEDFREFASITTWPAIVKEHPALLNAESYAVAVSLIDQYRTSPSTFQFNRSVITNTINNTAPGEFLPGPLLLNLANPAF
ncbi:hypothetical protein [Pseudomonas granadensis]|uniref:hypothetical protein n=1 Tax=Pseudomonas granadensis TaxID=1421430 RepID=UPI000879F150|nr:hypothetical protein [Pseudomonas granadensis]SDT07179.1 hypothetical protein SAMN05216579_2405 [Pseudomonas granadensis]